MPLTSTVNFSGSFSQAMGGDFFSTGGTPGMGETGGEAKTSQLIGSSTMCVVSRVRCEQIWWALRCGFDGNHRHGTPVWVPLTTQVEVTIPASSSWKSSFWKSSMRA